jgi:hypothetical protein
MSISVVVTAKNDNYGGDLKFRANLALNQMINVFDEVIYVDWCSDGKSLLDELNLNFKKNLKHIRVLKKDLEPLNPSLVEVPMIDVLGRNVGVRRAKGDFILSTNIDIIISKIHEKFLSKNMMYISARRDIPRQLPIDFLKIHTEDSFLDFLIMHKNFFKQSLSIENFNSIDKWSVIENCGDFQLASREVWDSIKGFEESMIYRLYADSNLIKKANLNNFQSYLVDIDLFHIDHDRAPIVINNEPKYNDYQKDLINFTETKNSDNWGFANYAFFEEVL